MIQNLLDKHGDIEKRYEKFIQKQRKGNFRCRNCGEISEILRKLQEHKEEGCSSNSLKCDECENCFKDEKKLQDHRDKIHVKFECDECDKVFIYEAVLEKHKEGAHEDVELYCHYYNNDKDCPFDDECIYIHEESENCKYGQSCERKLCMFRHGEAIDEEDENDEESDDSDDQKFISDGVDVEKIKPLMEKFKKAVDNFEELLGKYSLKCKNCEFEAKDFNGLTMHMKAKHNN